MACILIVFGVVIYTNSISLVSGSLTSQRSALDNAGNWSGSSSMAS